MKLGSDRLAAAVLAAFLSLPLSAGETGTRACPAIDPPAILRPSFAKASEGYRGQGSPPGFRVFRDPETGQLRQPTRAEAAELARAEAEAAPEALPIFVVVEHPDGMKSVDLQGALMQSVVVTRNADGSLTYRCLPDRLQPAPAAPLPRARPAFEEK